MVDPSGSILLESEWDGPPIHERTIHIPYGLLQRHGCLWPFFQCQSIAGGLEVVDVLESEVHRGCLVVV